MKMLALLLAACCSAQPHLALASLLLLLQACCLGQWAYPWHQPSYCLLLLQQQQ
jgi:hypothetical protein